VAELNLQAVLEFYKVWPEVKELTTFVAGESYGGIYVPTLVNK
jgi:carboxypeptidase C (cathepsin A)